MISAEHRSEIESEIRWREYWELHNGKYECDDCEYTTNDKDSIEDHMFDMKHSRKHLWVD